MDSAIEILIIFAAFCLLGYGLFLIITKFFKEPIQSVALAIVGFLLLVGVLEVARNYFPMHHEVVTVR